LELLADFVADVGVGNRRARPGGKGADMKTVAEWLEKHPGVKVRMFERNYKKESGSGKFEAVCGFCLASHYFRNGLRKNCRLCLAPFREGSSISRLAEILSQRWRIL
jgi:hypothetical protein